MFNGCNCSSCINTTAKGNKEYDNKIKIFRTEDLGPATKLIPTVERITDPETIIIVCDDDLVYHPDMIKEHIKNQTYKNTFFSENLQRYYIK